MWRHPVWGLGFRPFFLLAALVAVIWTPLWAAIYGAAWSAPVHLAAPVWHGHEMLFGFAAAVVAGFLLSAVPNWTGVPARKGGALAALVLIWMGGRVTMLLGAWIPAWLVAVVDASFFPALVLAIRPAIVDTASQRNFLFPRALMGFAAANVLIHLGAMRIVPGGEEIGLKVAVALVTVLMVVIGGRVIPAFTANAIGSAPRSPDWTDRWALYTVLAVAALEFLPALPEAQGVVALAAGVLNCLRMRGWQSLKTSRQPIVWVLHIGYAWIVIGLLIKGFALLTDLLRWQDAVHGLTAGAIGTLTLGMMSRVALGHTGRPLRVHPAIAFAYLMISVATMLRIAAPLSTSGNTLAIATHISSGLWAGAFLIYLVFYTRILVSPRIDGRPG